MLSIFRTLIAKIDPRKPGKAAQTGYPQKRASSRFGGVLFTLSCLLILSAVFRVSEYAGAVLARATEQSEMLDSETALAEPAPPISSELASCEYPEDVSPVMAALTAREARIREREQAYMDREAALNIVNQEIEKRLSQLEDAELALSETLALAETAFEDDLSRLTSIYENMKPAEAAPLFEAMDPQFAAGFLSRMRSETAAGIFERLSPDIAYSVSSIIASRNSDTPQQ